MIIDKRRLERTIEIKISGEGKNAPIIDNYIDSLMGDLKVVLTQNALAKNLKIEIILS